MALKNNKISLLKNDKIILKGVRVNNLKNINVEIPKNKFVVITGLSGSGKSSLAFDTIFAEGQRLYLESLSTYARQFANIQSKPDFDFISGLSPAIAIDQKNIANNPRSTVATMTEIYDHLRLLYARIGKIYCPHCGSLIQKQSAEKIIEKVAMLYADQDIYLLAPVIKNKIGLNKKILNEIATAGFKKIRLNNEFIFLTGNDDLRFNEQEKNTLEILVSELRAPKKINLIRQNLAPQKNNWQDDSLNSNFIKNVKLSLDLGNGFINIYNPKNKKENLFSEFLACPKCDFTLSEIEPRLFSFNSPYGACENCAGLGVKEEFDPNLIIPNKKLTLLQGAIRPFVRSLAKNQNKFIEELKKVAEKNNFNLNTPLTNFTKKQLEILLYGKEDFEGVIKNLHKKYLESDSDYLKSEFTKYMRVFTCPTCAGKRLNKTALAVKVAGKSIAEITAQNIVNSLEFFQKLPKLLSAEENVIAEQIVKEINKRLEFLQEVGLEYLTLNRSAQTLSGGEAQRIKLATQTSAGLTGIIYILDEPSIGLHPKDNAKLIQTLKAMRDLGNSILVVEHDKETMLLADYILDIGPGAGKYGGEVVAVGTPEEIKKNKNSLTGAYLANKNIISFKTRPILKNKKEKILIIKKAAEFNLKNIDVKIPLGQLVCLTGVSGSGKSTLVTEILSKALAHHFYQSKDLPGKHEKIIGLEYLDKIIAVDQDPIGRTPRSNPATYTGVFTAIREIFATTNEAKIKRFDVGSFSFNVVGGRCETCGGDGYKKIEMNFLPDVFVKCEDCAGKRFRQEILAIHYKNKNIADVLAMTVSEAMDFFAETPTIYQKLKVLFEVGLEYLTLGQPANTLSGGEAQRIKLATELMRRSTGKTLYILDEPTTGLHFEDIKKLLHVLYKLVATGNTVLVVEHNLDVIKNADWVIDLGPEGGDKGGYIVAEGTPEEIANNKKSWTGKYLKKVLK